VTYKSNAVIKRGRLSNRKSAKVPKMKVLPNMSTKTRTIVFYLLCVLIVLAGNAQASSQPYIPLHQVNFGTGNKYLSATDVSIGSPAGTLSFTRTYNSQSSTTSEFGYGWTATFTERLTIATDSISLVQPGGRYIVFKNDGSGNWINQTGAKQTITANTGGYQLKELRGTIKQYDGTGHLVSVTDRNSNTRTYTYSSGLVDSISDNFGRSLTFAYTAGKLTGMTSAIGSWTYSYLNDNLVEATKPDGKYIQYIYDDPNDAHNLTGVIDESGTRVLTVTYDNLDRVTSAAKAADLDKVTITYPATNVREVTNSLGLKTTYQLNVANGIAMVDTMAGPGCSSCGDNANTKYLYDNRLQVVEATDASGVKTTSTRDASGNKTSVTKAAGTPLASTTTYTYDPATNQPATITRPSVANPGQQTVNTMTYDTHGNLLNQQRSGYSGTTAINATTTYTYNSYGQIATIDGPRADVTDTATFTYYANDAGQGLNRGNLSTVKDALNHTTTFSNYNAFGQAQTVTDPNGIVTSRVYDAGGLLTSSTTADLTTAYAYDPADKLQAITLPGNRVITYTYSAAGQVAKITDSIGNVISYTYDSEGRRTGEEVHDPQNVLTRSAVYGYDNYGRMNKVTLPGNAEETAEYDLVGNLVKTVNANVIQTDYQYDVLNRLLSLTKAATNTTGYTFDAHSNVTEVTDAKSKATSFTYDDFGRMVTTTSPDTGQNAYSYDLAGNLISMSDAKGQSTTMQYDALNRPVKQSYAGTGDILFSYDQGTKAIDKLSGITDREGTDSFTYDSSSRIVTDTRVIDSRTHAVSQVNHGDTIPIYCQLLSIRASTN